MLQEIWKLPTLPQVQCMTDNASLVESIKSTKLVPDKRLRVDIARLKEMISNNEVSLHWVKGQDQLSDCLTKAGASSAALRDILLQ